MICTAFPTPKSLVLPKRSQSETNITNFPCNCAPLSFKDNIDTCCQYIRTPAPHSMEPSNTGSSSSQDSLSFPGTSFAQANNQFGLQVIPTQTPYPPLFPSSLQPSNSAASSSTAHDGTPSTAAELQFPIEFSSSSLSTTTSVADVSSPPQSPPEPMSSTPPTTGASPPRMAPHVHEYYKKLANEIKDGILGGWVPRYMPPEEVYKHRLKTQQIIERIHVLEGQRARMLPTVKFPLERDLFIMRVNYRLLCLRTFRINHLPTEIFAHILRLVCWSTPTPQKSITQRLTITSTCRHWRTIAIADNILWNAIMFSDYPRFERSFEWFERSGNAALDIRINSTEEKPWTIAMARNVLGRLFTKLSTIRALVIVMENWDPLLYTVDALRIVKEQNLPMILERLEIHRIPPTHQLAYPRELYVPGVPLFGGADVPTLNYLTANTFHIDWLQSSLKGLHTLKIRQVPLECMPSLRDFRKILTDSPGLRMLALNAAGPKWPQGPYTVAPIEIPTLRELAMGEYGPLYATYVASQFTSANVVDLEMKNVGREDFSVFWNFMTGRLPSLCALSFIGADLFNKSPQARMIFLKWLQSIPKLSFLRVDRVAPVLMEMLLYDIKSMQSVAKRSDHSLTGAEPTSNPACPGLTTLEIHNMDTDYIVSWVTARKEMGIPVQKMYINAEASLKMSSEDRQKLALVMQDSSGGMVTLDFLTRPDEELQLIEDP
ncbi:hypothetical protein BJ912DRAFT_941087 [Pholiota molesta]|nr:hypothetical protein BJ912DRAFT_941087 [Pholiota molesta]